MTFDLEEVCQVVLRVYESQDIIALNHGRQLKSVLVLLLWPLVWGRQAQDVQVRFIKHLKDRLNVFLVVLFLSTNLMSCSLCTEIPGEFIECRRPMYTVSVTY